MATPRTPPMSDSAGYEDIGTIPLTPALDMDTEKLKAETIKKLDRRAIEEQITEKSAEVEVKPIPVELPMLFFRYGSKLIGCEKFNTDMDENRMIAKHLTVIFGKVDSRLFSVFVIVIIVVGKVVQCKDVIWQKLGFDKKPDDKKPAPAYNIKMDKEIDAQTLKAHQNRVQKITRELSGIPEKKK